MFKCNPTKGLRYACAISLGLLLTAKSPAAQESSQWTRDAIQLIGTEELGLAGRVHRVVADGKGGLWVAGRGQLVAWNGQVDARFRSQQTAWMLDGTVAHIAVSGGTAWFGTPLGVGRLSSAAPAWYGADSGLPDARITALRIDPVSAEPVVGTWRGTAHAAGGRFVAIEPSEPVLALSTGSRVLPSYASTGVPCADEISAPTLTTQLLVSVQGEVVAGDRDLWLCGDTGWVRIADEINVRALLEGRDGAVWVGTDRGVAILRDGSLEWLSPPIAPVNQLVWRHDRVLAAGEDGVWQCSADGCTAWELSGRQVGGLSIDARNDAWLTADGQLYRCNDDGCRLVDETEITAVGDWGPVETDSMDVWIGSTQGHGIVLLRDGETRRWSPDRFLPDADVHDMALSGDALLLATAEGLIRFDGSQFVSVQQNTPFYTIAESRGGLWVGGPSGLQEIGSNVGLAPDQRIRATLEVDGDLWIGGPDGLQHSPAGGALTDHTRWLPSASVRDLTWASDGSVWVATGSGLARFVDGTWVTYGRDDGLLSGAVWAVHADRRGGVWAGTFGGGAARFEGDGFRTLTSADGLPSNVVRQILSDDDGDVWFVTDRGLATMGVEHLPDLRPAGARWPSIAAISALVLVALVLWHRRRVASAVLLTVLATDPAQAQDLVDATVERRAGSGWIDISYQLPDTAADSVWIFAEASTDGVSWQIPVVTIAGDIGRVPADADGRAVWYAVADVPLGALDSCQVRLLWSTSSQPPGLDDVVTIPGGPFVMGSDHGDRHEAPRRVERVAAYAIDRHETTNRQFQRFVQSTGWRTVAEGEGTSTIYQDGGYHNRVAATWWRPTGAGSSLRGKMDHPVVQIAWSDAQAYCAWAGKRLPTEREWERAARGTDGRTYPWGEGRAHDPGRANAGAESCCRESDHDGFLTTAPVGSFARGVSPEGVHDMAGNVWEWTADPFLQSLDRVEGGEMVLRGGSWISYPHMLRTSYRGHHTKQTRHNYSGFRCAADVLSDEP